MANNKKGNPMSIPTHLFQRLRRLGLSLALACAVFFISGPAAADPIGAVEPIIVARADVPVTPNPLMAESLVGIPGNTVDDGVLSSVYGKGMDKPEASPTTGVAVILWDETGQRGGKNVQIQDTGRGNVQTTSITYNVQ